MLLTDPLEELDALVEHVVSLKIVRLGRSLLGWIQCRYERPEQDSRGQNGAINNVMSGVTPYK